MEWTNYAEYLKSDVWKEKRKVALERAQNRCQLCYSAKRLEVHHRTYRNRWGNEDNADLTVLCHRCHHKFTFKIQKRKEKKRKHFPPTKPYAPPRRQDNKSQQELRDRIAEAKRLKELRERYVELQRQNKQPKQKAKSRYRFRRKSPPIVWEPPRQTCDTPTLGTGN